MKQADVQQTSATNSSGRTTRDSFCRACGAYCPAHIEIENGRTVALRPVKDNPVFHGYACAKGRASVDFPYLEGRLLHSLKRTPDGGHERIESGQAIREIADIIQRTIAKYGPRAVAMYTGTWGSINLPSATLGDAFMAAIDSPMSFISMHIDQPGKPIASALHGLWLAGQANADQADAWLVIGTNPAISMSGPPNPAHATSRAKKRGAKIYVIDPRRTEIAQQADIFLQAPPGQDAAILAALINVILDENLYDQAFVAENVRGLDILRRHVADFTPEFVASRTGLDVEDLKAVARGYAASKSGIAFAGTGPNMSPHGTLVEYLRLALMSICGHWRRAGDPIATPSALVHLPPPLAQAVDPSPGWDHGHPLRVRGLTRTACGMPTSALAEEVLLEGEGQVRVLIVSGGNPMLAWPDQLLTQAAMKKLDLLVCIDPVLSATAEYAHYVIAPRVHFESMGTTALLELLWGWFPHFRSAQTFATVTPALVEPPPGADLIHDWQFYFDLARAMNLQLKVKPISHIFNPPEAQKREVALDMRQAMSEEQLWDCLLADSPLPLAEIKAHPEGIVVDSGDQRVLPKVEGWSGKLDIGNAEMMQDLRRAHAGEAQAEMEGFRFKLVGRRLKDRYNSSWREHDVATRQWTYNPAFMHPDDMASLGIVDGDLVEIRSRRATIKGIAEAEHHLLPGVIAMTHAWGGNPGADDPVELGANTGMLTDTRADCDPYSALPRMSTIPVNITLIDKGAEHRAAFNQTGINR